MKNLLVVNQRKNRDRSDYINVVIGQNTEKNPGDLTDSYSSEKHARNKINNL